MMTSRNRNSGTLTEYEMRQANGVTCCCKSAVTFFALFILADVPDADGLRRYHFAESQRHRHRTPARQSCQPRQSAFEYEGDSYDVLQVPTESGISEWALSHQRDGAPANSSIPANPEAGLIEWEGNCRQLEPVREFAIQWDNYPQAWNTISFARLLANTLGYAMITMVGTVASSACAAYGFARFQFPFKNVLFMIMIGTIVLPPAVTLVPTYAFFVNVLGWGW